MNRDAADGEVQVVGSDEAWERMLIAAARPGADLAFLGQLESEGRPAAR